MIAPPAGLRPDSCDTHVHVFDPAWLPYASVRSYTPAPARIDSLQALHAALGIERDALPDEAAWQRLLVDNPARLYGFDS